MRQTEVHPGVCDTRTLFARHGLRCTRQRIDVYDVLAASKAHPTAEELYWLVKQSQPGLSLATVYNTLEAFCSHGLCRKLATADGGARFDADLSEHLHLVTEDGRMHDVPADLGARMLDSLPRPLLCELERRMGVAIRQVRLEFLAGNPPDRADQPRVS